MTQFSPEFPLDRYEVRGLTEEIYRTLLIQFKEIGLVFSHLENLSTQLATVTTDSTIEAPGYILKFLAKFAKSHQLDAHKDFKLPPKPKSKPQSLIVQSEKMVVVLQFLKTDLDEWLGNKAVEVRANEVVKEAPSLMARPSTELPKTSALESRILTRTEIEGLKEEWPSLKTILKRDKVLVVHEKATVVLWLQALLAVELEMEEKDREVSKTITIQPTNEADVVKITILGSSSTLRTSLELLQSKLEGNDKNEHSTRPPLEKDYQITGILEAHLKQFDYEVADFIIYRVAENNGSARLMENESNPGLVDNWIINFMKKGSRQHHRLENWIIFEDFEDGEEYELKYQNNASRKITLYEYLELAEFLQTLEDDYANSTY